MQKHHEAKNTPRGSTGGRRRVKTYFEKRQFINPHKFSREKWRFAKNCGEGILNLSWRVSGNIRSRLNLTFDGNFRDEWICLR